MAGVWKLASGDMLIVPKGTQVLIVTAPPHVVNSGDHTMLMRTMADGIERAAKALDEGRVEELVQELGVASHVMKPPKVQH